MSGYANSHSNIADLADQKDQADTLNAFGKGDINLLVCTNVLEEGVDVPNCHVVICFDPPKNLKSFIQRRGRARKEESKYILFLPMDDESANPTKWQSLEAILQAAYEDDLRAVKEAEERESEDKDGSRSFRVASTG
jgi:ERCC4-related helicase